MTNPLEFPIGKPEVLNTQVPILDEQVEDVKSLDLHDPELWDRLEELRKELERNESDGSEYNKMMGEIERQLLYNYEHNISDGWEEQKDKVENNKIKVSKEDKKKEKEDERLEAIERYKNGLDELYEKDGTEKYTDI